jgi:hypothetical protein
VKLTAKSTIRDAIAAVSTALEKAGIKAVLVGGACATVYSGETYQSEDLDLILKSAPTQRQLDSAMAAAGFKRREAQYFHQESDFFVEFPRGPLAIGQDLEIVPTRLSLGRARVTALSATDSCRDRLAAFYHWGDRQSLEVAVSIALRHRINMKLIRHWSEGEGSFDKFKVFEAELVRAKGPKRPVLRSGSPRKKGKGL